MCGRRRSKICISFIYKSIPHSWDAFVLYGELDIITQIHRRFSFDDVFNRSRSFTNGEGVIIHFLHLNDLRELKVLARRPQNLRDVVMIDDFIKLFECGDQN